jgi:quercetin dioxygenase-like cupin family protein
LKIVKTTEAEGKEAVGGIFTGGQVIRRSIIGSGVSQMVQVGLVSFAAGARNILHTHSGEQILYITEGRGMVGTEEAEFEVTPGTLIHIPAGERHWHGATADCPMSHLTIVSPTSETR